jgi:ankyrin repeat protein
MRVAAVNGNANVAKILIHHGANVNGMDKEAKTVLMNAALNGFEALVKLLVKKGAIVNQKSDYGKTALDFARSFEHENVVKFLHDQVEMLKSADRERRLEEARSAEFKPEMKNQESQSKIPASDAQKENISDNGQT